MNLIKICLLVLSLVACSTPVLAELTPGQERQLREFYERKRMNGPTGQLVMEDGTYRLLRVGTRSESLPLSFRGYGVGFRVDELKSITNAPPNDLIFETWDGKSATENSDLFSYYVHEALRTGWPGYPSKSPGLPFVVEDPRTKAAKLLFVPDLEGLVRIEFDEPAKWRDLPLTRLGENTPEEQGLLARFKADEQETSRLAPRIGNEREWMERVDREAKAALALAEASRPEIRAAAPETAPSAAPAIDPSKVAIGEKVCLEAPATMSEFTGILVGGRPMPQEVPGRARITAFIERVEASRVQFRNAGVMFYRSATGAGQPLTKFTYNDVQLAPGVIFWDSLTNWTPCP